MKLEDILDHAVRSCEFVKREAVRRARGRPRESDLPPCVMAWRGDEQVVIALAGQVNRDQGLELAHRVAVGFDADAIAFITDAYSAHPDLPAGINPLTGKEWHQGEMQDLVENHDGIARGWIVEYLYVNVVNKAGDIAGGGLQYTLTGRHIEMTPGPQYFGGIDGLVPDALRRAMKSPSMSEVLLAQGLSYSAFGMNHEEGRARQDAVASEQITEMMPNVTLMMVCEPGSIRHRIFRERSTLIVHPTGGLN